jgi:hypothetical protein
MRPTRPSGIGWCSLLMCKQKGRTGAIATRLYVDSGLVGIRVVRMDERVSGRLVIRIERRGVRRYTCSGCGRRTGRVRSSRDRTWDNPRTLRGHRDHLAHGLDRPPARRHHRRVHRHTSAVSSTRRLGAAEYRDRVRQIPRAPAREHRARLQTLFADAACEIEVGHRPPDSVRSRLDALFDLQPLYSNR